MLFVKDYVKLKKNLVLLHKAHGCGMQPGSDQALTARIHCEANQVRDSDLLVLFA